MLNLTGRLINVFKQQGGKNKQGETFEDRDKIQILGSLELPNGEIKNELVTLSVANSNLFVDLLNREITVPVGCMAMGKSVIYYVTKGAKPQIVA
jgi:hypothetical protein